MKVSEFHSPQPAVKFGTIGDRIDGVIVDEPELQADKYGGPCDQVLVLAILDAESVTRRLYARRQMLTAIGQAVSDAGVDEIEVGGRLRVEYTEDKPTGSGSQPMKLYWASYEAPAPVGVGTFGTDDQPTLFDLELDEA